MVGGTVIGLARGIESTLVHVQDSPPYANDRCSIRVVERRYDNKVDLPQVPRSTRGFQWMRWKFGKVRSTSSR
jgi:hypothetical protein